MRIILILILGLMSINASPVESDIPAVEPAYLDQLRDEGRYEEFSKLLGIPDPKLAKEKDTGGREELSMEDAMMHEGLQFGDIITSTAEEGRQNIRFDRDPEKKWQNRKVPYEISQRDYDPDQRRQIEDAINYWNRELSGYITLTPRDREDDYVFVFSGEGCYSHLGRRGKQQVLSIQKNGCIRQGIIVHEFEHAIGFVHEHCRYDRDNFVEILWRNIPLLWRLQYIKTDERNYGIINNYDYYSVMHYPYNAPKTKKPAFRIKQNGIDVSRMGRSNEFTPTDIAKIKELYRNVGK